MSIPRTPLALPDAAHLHQQATASATLRGHTWFALGAGWMTGMLMFFVSVLGISSLFTDSGVRREALWLAPTTGWQPWALVAAASLLPLLAAAGVAGWLAADMRRVRRCVALLLPLVGMQALCSVTGEPLRFYGLTGWWSASSERLLLVSGSVSLAAAAAVLGCVWLLQVITHWQPPTHLVRRPAAH